MIGKVPKAGRGFKGVVRYLLHGSKERENNSERVAWTEVRNLTCEDPETAAALMRATAHRSRRCRAPAYHFVVSWREEENANDGMMRQVADRSCSDLGLDDYQRLYVAHADTKHRHLHVVVNRIHPETGKAWNRRQDWVRLERSLAEQSRELGLEHVPGRHNDPERVGELERRERDGEFQRTRRLARDQLKPWAAERVEQERAELAALFDKAGSWDELDTSLARRGLRLERKGQGYVIADETGAMKLSALGKGYGRQMLIDKFERPDNRDKKRNRTLERNSDDSDELT